MYTTPIPQSKINYQFQQKAGTAIYLLAYLIDKANWETGKVYVKYSKVEAETGFAIASIRKWMKRLRDIGEIDTAKIPYGLMVTIKDYQSVARTRGVNYQPPQVSDTSEEHTQHPSDCNNLDTLECYDEDTLSDSDRPNTIPGVTRSEQSERYKSNMCPPKSEHSNIIQNMYKTKERNFTKTRLLSFLSCVPRATPQKGDELFIVDPKWDMDLRKARDRVENLADDKLDELIEQALISIAQDPKPFIRIFVKANEDGQLEIIGNSAPEMLLRRMGEILVRADSTTDNSQIPDSEERPPLAQHL